MVRLPVELTYLSDVVGFNRESATKTDSARVGLCVSAALGYMFGVFPSSFSDPAEYFYRGHPTTRSIIAATGQACKPFLCFDLTIKTRCDPIYSDNSTFVQRYNYHLH